MEFNSGKLFKPKVKYSFTINQKKVICEWVKILRMPDDYAAKLDKNVNINGGRLFCLKSHDCHMFMECLLSIAFITLPDLLWSPIVKLNQIFQDLHAITLWKSELVKMKENIPLILCKLK